MKLLSSLFGSFRARVFFLTTLLVLLTALSITVFQHLQMEKHFVAAELLHAQNLLNMTSVHIENQYDSYLFFRDSLINERKRNLKSIVEISLTEIEKIHQKSVDGELTELAARQLAMNFARRLRYADETGYVWINNSEKPHPVLLMHPTMPELEGKVVDSDLPIFNTARGKGENMFEAFVEVCSENGEGYVDYLWPKPTSSGLTENQPKLSFVKLFKPWHWIIGTGLYMDDIERDSLIRIEAIVKELRKAFAKIKITENSSLFIFDGNYNVLVPPDRNVKELITISNPVSNKTLIDQMMATAKISDQTSSSQLKTSGENRESFFRNKKILVNHFFPLDWYVVAYICMDDLNAPLKKLRWDILMIVALLLFMALILASVLARSLSLPLQGLVDAVQKVEADGLHARAVPVSGTRETRKLGRYLNSMLASIKFVSDDRDILLKEILVEEEKHRTTLNSIGDAVISMDTNGKILGMNRMAEVITGWEFKDAYEQPIGEVYRVMDSEGVVERDNPVEKFLKKAGKCSVGREVAFLSLRDKQFEIEEQVTPILGENGDLKGVVLVFRDITEEFLNKQKLKETEWKFQALFEYGPLAVAYHQMIYDDSGDPLDFFFIDANSNYRELLGVDPRGKMVKEAFPDIENDSFDWIDFFGKVAKEGEPQKFNHYLLLNDRWFDGIVFRYKPDHFVTAFFDVTEQRRFEQQIAQSQKMDAIGQLAGGIAHDFNNVLGGILGASELLESLLGDKDFKARKFLGIIRDSSERAVDLIKKLLVFGRKENLNLTTIDAHEAVHEAVALLECSLDKKIKIDLNLLAETYNVLGDLSQLQSVFLNLGINASHAMNDGGTLSIDSCCIHLDASAAKNYSLESGAYIKFEVRDTGIGIAPEHLTRIFEPFFTTKSPGHGTGLGLAASFGIIKQHHGSISVYSDLNVGTVFHILLPLTSGNKMSQVEPFAPIPGHGRILVIDDEKIIRETTTEILNQLGYEALVAENGATGLELFKKERENIDLVLLDMIMPKMNGHECFQKMKEIDPEVKVILASGFSQEDDIEEMINKGLCGFIQKPYLVTDLSILLQNALRADKGD